jgi:hypothetical protein
MSSPCLGQGLHQVSSAVVQNRAETTVIELVGGFNHFESYESQWEGLSHILWKVKKIQTTNQ